MAFITNIENDTQNNIFFRKVLFTTNNMQLVVMSIAPNDNIPVEKHDKVDQFIRIEKGVATAIINNTMEYTLKDGDAIIIPSGTWHEIINKSTTEPLKLYTIYTPPEHAKNKIDVSKPNEDDDYYKNKYLKYKEKYLIEKSKTN